MKKTGPRPDLKALVFIDLGVRSDFLIPKLHSMNHHTDFITQFGTMDNCNTEYTERLHIDLAKDAYRSTNKKDEYPQMTLWLERREKILFHRRYLQRRAQTTPSIPPKEPPPRLLYPRTLQMAKFPSVNGVSVRSIEQDYGATHLLPTIRRFVMQYQEPNKPWTRLSLEKAAANVPITFRKLSVYHHIKFREADRYCVALDHTGQRPSSVVDSIHVEPGKTTKKGKESRARFDTALIAIDDDPPDVGIDGKRISQVRCVFKFSKTSLRLWFDGLDVPLPPHHLAYVEWFTPFNRRVDPNHKMLKVSRTVVDGERQASIVPVDNICRSIHLIPHYGRRVPDEWSSDNVLDKCKDFFVNTASDRHCYASIYVK